MASAVLFGEDIAHELILTGLARRIAKDAGREISISVRSATGGFATMQREVSRYLASIERGRATLPDLIIVGRDANCQGYGACRQTLESQWNTPGFPLVFALPDPHIERWLMLDSSAFKRVLGKGCSLVEQKCDKERYKIMLQDEVRKAGLRPLQRGLEHAEDIVHEMDLARSASADPSIKRFLSDLRTALKASPR